MELTYRGQSYTPDFPNVEAQASVTDATYRGRRYQIKQYKVARRAQSKPSAQFIYRGQTYIG